MKRLLEIPLFMARKIDKIAEKNNMNFSEAAIFLLEKVLTPKSAKNATKETKGGK